MNAPHIEAHQFSIRHRVQLTQSEYCGCFYCLHIFRPETITRWIDDGDTQADQTALCPQCGIDSVIGSKSGFPIDAQFLQQMHEYWF